MEPESNAAIRAGGEPPIAPHAPVVPAEFSATWPTSTIRPRFRSILQQASFCGLAVLLCTGCFSHTTVQITHSPIASIEGKRNGHILVRPFVDERSLTNKSIIGGTFAANYMDPRVRSKPVILKDGPSLSEILTGQFAEALKMAGYRVSVQSPTEANPPERYDGFVEGAIIYFWLTAVWDTRLDMRLQLRLRDATGKEVLWEKDILSTHSKFIGLYNASEFEEVIRKALDKALEQAVKEWASDDFQQKVQAGK